MHGTNLLKLFLGLIVLAGVGAGGYYAWNHYTTAASRPSFRTAPIERGDLVAAISATGTVEPEEVIDVGAQVAGQIKNFGRDPRDPTKIIDYGTPVEEGTVLLQLDDSLYRSQLEQAEANLKKAQADVG